MTSGAAQLPAWRAFLRRHERAIAGWYLAAVALLVLVFCIGPVRDRLLDAVQGVVHRWDGRWDRRLAEVRQGQVTGSARLAALLRDLPAPSPRHARDADRLDLYLRLARAQVVEGRPEEALATYDSAIAYNPRTYVTPYLKGLAAKAMGGDSALRVARAAFDTALAVFPNHLPSLREAVALAQARGDTAGARTRYAAWRSAFLSAPLDVTVGDTTFTLRVVVDGRPHAVAVPARGRADSIAVLRNAFDMDVSEVEVMPAAAVGAAVSRVPLRLPVRAHLAPGGSPIVVRLPRTANGFESLRLTVTVAKPENPAEAEDAFRMIGVQPIPTEYLP